MDFTDKALREGPYRKALGGLIALSMAEIRRTIPTASYKDYGMLLWAVEQASAEDYTQKALEERIAALVETTLAIAKLVPGLDDVVK